MARRRPSIPDRIATANAGRDAGRLAIKYEAMAGDAFAFFRGTCHLFHEDWPTRGPLNRAPLVWACGDLHAENFGSYSSSDRIDRFDLTDFDEAALGPCTVDLARFAASLLVGAEVAEMSGSKAPKLVERLLEAYVYTVRDGKALWTEPATATGMVRDLLAGLDRRRRRKLLKKRTRKNGRALCVDGNYALPATADERRAVRRSFARHRARDDGRRLGRILDVARRVAGLGSLGVERFVVLVAGSAASRPSLLDLKAPPPSSLAAHFSVRQPRWRTEAERVVTLQRRMQAVPPALLQLHPIGRRAFVLRELQPREDRLALDPLPPWRALADAVESMAKVVAWAHLRGAGRQGSANTDELIAFAEDPRWHGSLLTYARAYAAGVERDWQDFVVARKAGFFGPSPARPRR